MLCLAGLLVITGQAAVPAAARDPQAGDFFEYSFHRHVGDGSGEYYGYADDTFSNGHYEVGQTNATHVSMHTVYTWSFANNEGTRQGGTENRFISFSLTDRRYTSPQTDFDELDGEDPTNYAVWFWIPPTVRVGDVLRVLDANFRVTSLDATVWLGFSPRKAIEIKSSGYGSRDDIYGIYNTEWTDTYYYDRATGWFVAERYVETDRGTWQGEYATFKWTEDLDFKRGSYEPPTDVGSIAFLWGLVGTFGLLVAVTAYWARWRTRTVRTESLSSVRVGLLKPGQATMRPGTPEDEISGVTHHFGRFLDDFARKGQLANDRVAFATRSGDFAGMAWYSKDAKVGTVMAEETGLAEILRRFVGAKEFFSEWRHQVPAAALEAAQEMGTPIARGDAYNLFDTYLILQLDAFPNAAYDTSLVQQMGEADLPAIADISRTVYKIRSDRWLAAQLHSGDIGYVARLDGNVVGFAFANLSHGGGRIHSATVLPEYRNRGIGRELLRARLAALEALGAQSVVAEVAEWNLASLELLYSHGFKRVDKMYVETARRRKPKLSVVRR